MNLIINKLKHFRCITILGLSQPQVCLNCFHELCDRAGELAQSSLLREGSPPRAAAVFRAGSGRLHECRGEEREESTTASQTTGNQQPPQRRETAGRPETAGNAALCAGTHAHMQRGETLCSHLHTVTVLFPSGAAGGRISGAVPQESGGAQHGLGRGASVLHP